MYNLDKLFRLVKELNKLFVKTGSENNKTYSNISQLISNTFLFEFAHECGVLEKTKNTEKNNIETGLVLEDKETGQKTPLIDIDSMSRRVDTVLDSIDMHACLKSLAVSNKCAHSFDSTITSLQNSFITLYERYSGVLLDDVSFMRKFDEVCPDIDKIPKEFINLAKRLINKNGRYMTNKEFFKIYEALNPSNDKINHIEIIKKFLINDLKVSFKDDKEALNLFTFFKNNRNKLYEAYMYVTYGIGASLVAIQSEMFSIKSNYISMIAQLISNGEFKDIKNELIKTTGKEGFKHMLIIDDPELSYYIEVHMPDYLKEELTREYGFVVSEERSTPSLGASAVYRRDKEEIKDIKDALNEGKLDEKKNKAQTRAKVITRDLNESEDVSIGYEYKTKEIPQTSVSFLREFLREQNIHTFDDILRFTSKFLENENYSLDQTFTIVNNYHYNIYMSLNNLTKELFISNSLNGIEDEKLDEFDKELLKALRLEDDSNKILKQSGIAVDKDLIAKVLIFKDSIKRDYFESKTKKNMQAFINDAIEDYRNQLEMEKKSTVISLSKDKNTFQDEMSVEDTHGKVR